MSNTIQGNVQVKRTGEDSFIFTDSSGNKTSHIVEVGDILEVKIEVNIPDIYIPLGPAL